MRVVFDSNIFISAFVVPGSKAEKAITRVINQKDRLVLSRFIIDEILSVLSGKFNRDREIISRTAIYLTDLAEVVTPSKKIRVLKDDPDNRILECAMAGNADCIVTGDKDMLSLKKYQDVKIISLSDYLKS
jgi:putative PIN family toxin of toxin-antitoxin system